MGVGQVRVAVKLEACVRELTYSRRNSQDSYTRCRRKPWSETEEMLDFSGLSMIIIWIHEVLQELACGWAPAECSSGGECVPIVGAKDKWPSVPTSAKRPSSLPGAFIT